MPDHEADTVGGAVVAEGVPEPQSIAIDFRVAMNSVLPASSKPSILTNIIGHTRSTYVVLVLGTVASVAAAVWEARQVEREARLKFENAVTDARDAVQTRIHAYSDVLYGIKPSRTAGAARPTPGTHGAARGQ